MKGVESSLGAHLHEAAVNMADDAMSDEDDDQCDILPPTKKYKQQTFLLQGWCVNSSWFW